MMRTCDNVFSRISIAWLVYTPPVYLFQEDFCSNANPVQLCREARVQFFLFLLPAREWCTKDIRLNPVDFSLILKTGLKAAHQQKSS